MAVERLARALVSLERISGPGVCSRLARPWLTVRSATLPLQLQPWVLSVRHSQALQAACFDCMGLRITVREWISQGVGGWSKDPMTHPLA